MTNLKKIYPLQLLEQIKKLILEIQKVKKIIIKINTPQNTKKPKWWIIQPKLRKYTLPNFLTRFQKLFRKF